MEKFSKWQQAKKSSIVQDTREYLNIRKNTQLENTKALYNPEGGGVGGSQEGLEPTNVHE